MQNSHIERLFCEGIKADGLVKSKNLPSYVIPAKAGIQSFQTVLDSHFHGSDGISAFYEAIKAGASRNHIPRGGTDQDR